MFTTIYARLTDRLRNKFFDYLYQICTATFLPWLLAGDFNTFIDKDETTGTNPHVTSRCAKFLSWINSLELIDLDFSGSLSLGRNGSLKLLIQLHALAELFLLFHGIKFFLMPRSFI